MIQGASDESVRLTLNSVEKRLVLFKQELELSMGLRRGTVVTYNSTSRAGTAAIDNKEYPFRALDTTIAVGDTCVFMRLSNFDRGFILLGVIL